MGPVNKQDVQSIVETSRNRIVEKLDRVALKQDIQALMDCVKSLLNVHQQNQQLLRQAEYQRLQMIRRMTALEARMAQIEQYSRTSHGTLNKVAQAAARPQQPFFGGPAPASPPPAPGGYSNQYGY
jgi:ribosomal 50S subunit-associated protein YjgA (DUF615 family)